MKTSVKKIERGLLISVEGDLDMYSAPDFKEQVSECIIGFRQIIISLERVKYIDSSGIGVMLNLFCELNNKLTDIVFCDLVPDVQKILSLSQLDTFLPIKSTFKQAQDFFKERVRA